MAVRAIDAGLVTAVRLLAERGRDALPALLDQAAAELPGLELTIRPPVTGDAVHGESGPRVPPQAAAPWWSVEVPLRADGRLHGVLSAVADQPVTEAQAAVLGSYADLCAVALALPAGARDAAARLVLDEEAERAELAALLQDSVGEALVTIRYAADQAAAAGAPPTMLEETVRAAADRLKNVQRDLRAQALDDGLVPALRQLVVRSGGNRPADGQPTRRVTLVADDRRLALLPPATAATVQRVAEVALRGAAGDAVVRVTLVDQTVKLAVESADIAYDASEMDRWARRATALGGDLTARPTGVKLHLPAPPTLEGHDDNRPHL